MIECSVFIFPCYHDGIFMVTMSRSCYNDVSWFCEMKLTGEAVVISVSVKELLPCVINFCCTYALSLMMFHCYLSWYF